MATLTIDLDDQATDGLDRLNEALVNSATAAETAAEGADTLTASQSRQLVVIHNNKKGLADFGSTAITVFGEIGIAGINSYTDITNAGEKAFESIAVAGIKGATSVAKYAIVSIGAVQGLKAVWGNHANDVNSSMEETISGQSRFTQLLKSQTFQMQLATAAVADQAAGYQILSKAAEYAGGAAVKRFLGIAPQLAVITVGLDGYAALLARTGIKTVELADGTKVLETNLDRVNAASNKLGTDISRDITAAANAFTELSTVSLGLEDVWKDIDTVTTRGADRVIEEIGLVQEGYREATTSIRALAVQMTGGNAEAYRKEIGLMREQLDLTEKLAAQADRSREGFSLLSGANDRLQQAEDRRGEAARIAGIKSTDAIQSEIQKLKEKASADALAGKFNSDAEVSYFAKMETLEARKLAIGKEAAAERAKHHTALKEQYTEEMRLTDETIGRQLELYNLEKKRMDDKSKMGRELTATQQKEGLQTGLAAAKDAHAGEKDIAEQRLRQQGATELQIKTQLTEMDRTFSEREHRVKLQQIADEFSEKRRAYEREKLDLDQSGIDGIEYNKRLIKIKSDATKADFEMRKQAAAETGRYEREQNAMTANQRQAARTAEWKAIADQQTQEDSLKKTFNGAFDSKAFAQAQDPAKVKKQLQDNRALQEAQDQADRDTASGLFEKANSGNAAAIKKWNESQTKANNRGRRMAANDFENGTADNEQLTAAQAQVGQATVQALAKTGQINQTLAKAVSETLQGMSDQATATDALQASCDQLISFARGQKTTAKRQAENARNQQGSLE